MNVSAEYKDLRDVLKKAKNLILLNHSSYNYTINLKSERTFLFDLLYNFSVMKLNTLRKYLK